MYGYEVYKELRRIANVQVELGEVSVILALIGPGTTKKHLDNLINGLKELSKQHYKAKGSRKIPSYNYSYSKAVVPPREGYDAPNKIVNLKDSIGEISGETVMAYPPGIPIVIPGEIISSDAIKMIEFFHKEGGEVLKDTTIGKIKIIDRSRWHLAKEFNLE